MANQDSYIDNATGRTVKRGTPINRDNVNKPFQISERINDTATLVPSGNRKTNFMDVIRNVLNQNNPMKLYGDVFKRAYNEWNDAVNDTYNWDNYASAVGNDAPKTLDDLIDYQTRSLSNGTVRRQIKSRKPMDKNARPMGQSEYINETMKLS